MLPSFDLPPVSWMRIAQTREPTAAVLRSGVRVGETGFARDLLEHRAAEQRLAHALDLRLHVRVDGQTLRHLVQHRARIHEDSRGGFEGVRHDDDGRPPEQAHRPGGEQVPTSESASTLRSCSFSVSRMSPIVVISEHRLRNYECVARLRAPRPV